MDGVALTLNPFWQPKLGALGEVVTAVQELEQSLHIIIQTPKGAVPLDPEFGCDIYKYLDKPETTAIPRIIREITKAVKHCDPRIQIVKITVQSQTPGQKSLHISWKPTDSQLDSAIQETEVRLWPA